MVGLHCIDRSRHSVGTCICARKLVSVSVSGYGGPNTAGFPAKEERWRSHATHLGTLFDLCAGCWCPHTRAKPGRAHLDITFGCSVCVMLDAPDLRRTGGGERGISWAVTAGIRGLGSSLTSGLRACFGIPSPTAYTTVATSSRAAELEISVVLLMGLGQNSCQEAQCTYSSGCNANSTTSLVWWFRFCSLTGEEVSCGLTVAEGPDQVPIAKTPRLRDGGAMRAAMRSLQPLARFAWCASAASCRIASRTCESAIKDAWGFRSLVPFPELSPGLLDVCIDLAELVNLRAWNHGESMALRAHDAGPHAARARSSGPPKACHICN